MTKYIIKTSEGERAVGPEALRQLLDKGKLTETSRVRRESDGQLVSVGEILDGAGAADAEEAPAPVQRSGRRRRSAGRFEPPRGRATILLALLGLSFLALGASLVDSYLENALLQRDFTDAEADANDARSGIIGLALSGIWLLTIIFFARWILLVNRNAARWDKHVSIRGGWSVGWYFVPFANLWKPYQSMSEIFKASHAPAGILPFWWTLWLLAAVADRLSSKLYLRAEGIDDLISANNALMGAAVVSLLLCGVAMILVQRLTQAQEERAPEELERVFE